MADIIDTAMSVAHFTTLVNAITAASLWQGLKEPGPFTVFAPPDEAFAKLPSGAMEALLQDIPRLTELLTYHVVAGKYLTTDLAEQQSLETGAGDRLSLSNDGESMRVNQVKVTNPDIEVDNGVIHVIDAVLIPESLRSLDVLQVAR